MSTNARVGKLRFKQGSVRPTYLPKKGKKAQEQRGEEDADVVHDDQFIKYEPKVGSGQITTSGRTVHGMDTKFREEVENGDTIIITNPVFKTVEEGVVTLILSSKSILLETPFLEEYSSFVDYQIRKKTKVIAGENITEKYKQQLQQLGKTKAIKKEEMSLRIKKGMWAYKTETVEVVKDLSREQQLDIRQKMIKDKHCW